MKFTLLLLGVLPSLLFSAPANHRAPLNDADLRAWLENMVWHHRFTEKEITAATGLDSKRIQAALKRFSIRPGDRPSRKTDALLKVLPYPGGRHPRIGFLDGAIRPQRETKVSIFAPWDEDSYVVADIPEAIWSNLGLTYLAHTHVPTVWTKQDITLPRLEWQQRKDGTLVMERTLPNGIRFGTKVTPGRDVVRMEMWLRNGTKATLTGMRVQNCVMLKGASGFNQQTKDNKVLGEGWAACRSADGRRWIATGWQPAHRAWANPPVPCLHADPKFPDCPPGKTVRLKGWLIFHEGDDIRARIRKIQNQN